MIVARPAEKRPELFWRFAGELRPGAPVHVEEGDSATSLRHGQALGTFWPGQHVLPPQIPDGVELHFVLTRTIHGLQIGGNVGQFMAPGGTATARTVFGELSYRVTRPDTLLLNVVGSGPMGPDDVLAWLRNRVLKLIATPMAKLMRDGRDPALDPTAVFDLLDAVKESARSEITPEAGIEIVDIGQLQVR